MEQSASNTRIQKAIEVFARGFSFTRSFTHPYLAQQVGPLWVLRDAPRKRGDYRREEWIANRLSAEEIDQTVRQYSRNRFVICAICEDDTAQIGLRDGFKTLNYRLITSEPLMIHPLDEIPHVETAATIERVLTSDMAERLAKVARSRQILPKHLKEDAALRQYVACIEDQLVGWVRSIVVDDATWCSNMFVEPAFRRRGIARAMLSRMLADDRSYGAKQAVLLASHTGALLYPVVGYQQIGTLLLYAPKER